MNKLFKLGLTTLFFILLIQNNYFYGQNYLNSIDFSRFQVEKVSNTELNQIKNEMVKTNTTIEMLETIALSKGMNSKDFSLLKARLESNFPQTNLDLGSKIEEKPVEVDAESQNNPTEFASKIFGADLFTNPSLSFEPNSNMATPVNYILGGGDELQIIIYGIQEYAITAKISKEGKISIPNIGQLNVNSLTVEAATLVIKKACEKVFSTLKSGQSNLSVSLSQIRTIKVTIIGSKKPGNYSLSSLSTVFNALYVAGGPADNGSYRNIELIRGNKVIKKIDIYNFLIKGDQSDNIGLRDNDIIHIPVYDCRVSIEGEVKNSGIFELLPDENFNDLLKYCSGFTESAYLSTIKLLQNTEKEIRIVDLYKNEYENYKPKSGDAFKVGVILNRFENRISIKGSVFRPDNYSYTQGMTLMDLIHKADGLTEDAYRHNVQITRLKDDFSKEIISVDLSKALNGDSSQNILLRKEDEVLVFSLFDFKDVLTVEIGGKVRKPGTYPFVDKLTLFDLIIQSGGFTDDASKRIEISRVIKKDEIVKDQTELATIISLEIEDLEKDIAKNIPLEPHDVVQIRKMPIYETQKTAVIAGFVEFPGHYTLSNKNERILDIINRSGGLKTDANPDAIFIKRGDYIIPIKYTKIVKKPSSYQNIRIQPGDEITVLKYIPAIKIVGSIALNTEIPYVRGKNTHYYTNQAGGFSPNVSKKDLFIAYPNGTAAQTKRFLFIKFYPKVLPGSIINIPPKPPREKRNIQEFVSIASVSTSMATMIAVLTKLFQ